MARRLSDALQLARSGLVDRDYYQAQTGRRFATGLSAARHFLQDGADAGLSLHPLFEPAWLLRPQDDPGTAAEVVLDFLARPEHYADRSPHPLFDLVRARRQLRDRGQDRVGNAWLAWVLSAGPGSVVPTAKRTPALRWDGVRTSLIQAASRWRAGSPAAPLGWPAAPVDRPGTDLSIVVPAPPDLSATLRLPALTGGAATTELVCVGRLSRAQYCCLTGIGLTRRVTPVPATPSVADGADLDLAGLWNLGAARASGDRLVFLAPAATATAAALATLAAALDDPATAIVQPLNELPDMTIASAGAVYLADDPVPAPLLRAHPVTDAEPLAQLPLPAAHSAALAVRREDFAALDGFEPALGSHLLEVDLSLRAAAAGLGRTVLVADSRITARLPDEPSGSASAAPELLRQRHPTVPPGSEECLRAAGFTLSSGEVTRLRAGVDALPSLRWTIDTPVTAGWWAESWGDWHYAHSLARALRRLGQQVAVDTRQARGRGTRRFDDVLLTLRGMDEVRPAAAPVNLLWIIYNPQEVSAAEAAGYDRVFASSVRWSQQRTAEWGIPIQPLLQCTDAELFHPGRAGPEPEGGVLFVGNARRGGSRPMIDAALASGVELALYGTGWENVPAAAGRLTGLRVPNRDLGRRYAEAGIVLNDHLETMRQAGFVSNRLFDAVACGARVLSDPIDGAAELFGRSVVCCEPAQVAGILTGAWDDHWPSVEERLTNAARIRAEHSFDQRARVLLDAALEVLGVTA